MVKEGKRMKYKVVTLAAFVGSALAKLFSGWDTVLQVLLLFRQPTGLQAVFYCQGCFKKV